MNLSNCNRYVYLYPKLCVTHYPLPLLPYLEHYQIIDTLELRHQTPFHLQCPCILRCLRWHHQREPKQQFHHRSHGPRSLLLLWIPNRSKKKTSITYSLLIDMYIKDPKEKMHLLYAIETVPCTQCKANWALIWCISTNASFAKCMIEFAAVKGIFFSVSFCAIFWLTKCGLMPGLSSSNELISHDDGLHCDFTCLLYSKLINRLPESCVIDIISSAVNIEMKFVVDALPVELIGMKLIMMCDYIKFCADQLLIALGYQRHYKICPPLIGWK